MTELKARVKRIHLIGIGGSGLSAIARLLLESGYSVSGSDRSSSPLARELAAAGAQVSIGHHVNNVNGADLVVRSSAVPDENVEVQAAHAAGIPVLKRAEFLGSLMENHYGISVAGTHGKTTITAMIAWLLVSLGHDPSYIIGGTSHNLEGKNAHAGQGNVFVVEADEYDRMFLGLNPDLIIVSYLEHDHPDCFPTAQDYFAAFVDFVKRLRVGGILLASLDSTNASRLVAAAPTGTHAYTYGLNSLANYTARELTVNQHGSFDYDAWYQAQDGTNTFLSRISLQVPGIHNVCNSLAALAALHRSGLIDAKDSIQKAVQALGEYKGTGRRFDIRGEAGGIIVIDDYAHHPTEVRATLSAARVRYSDKRIWAVWQPHTFSRTLALLPEFAKSFDDADQVIITEVYAAREKACDFNNFSSVRIAEQMSHPGVTVLGTLDETVTFLLQHLKFGDVVLVLSAGDADQISTQVLSILQERNHHA